MTSERYRYYVAKISKDFEKELEKARAELKTSKSKRKDYRIIQEFFDTIINNNEDMLDNDEYDELLTDYKAMMPMPQSVSKQIACMLFEPKYLSPLYDLGIWEGFY